MAPGYPFFLAAVFKIFGENLFAVKLIQAVLGAITAVLVYFLALRMSRPAIAFLAASLMAVHPELLGITGFIYTEVLFIFLLVATLLLLAHAVQWAKPVYFLQAGVLFGLTTLCRGTTIYFPLMLLGLILFSSQRRLWLRRWA
ncbi:MAG: glycosyltransferase family 39 protein, partial [candidate division KSB1 bacterium]|nr:glycosyltransferase family 39 protein [candidate division KSB1 bacterium]